MDMALIGGIECLVHLYSATHWQKRKREKEHKVVLASRYPVFFEVECAYRGLFVNEIEESTSMSASKAAPCQRLPLEAFPR